MKIPVHEIEGDYYCAIDDIAVAWAQYMKQPTSGRNAARYFFEWCYLYILINNLDEYPHYIEYYGDINADHTLTRERLKENTLFYYDGKGDYRLLKNGFYHVAEAKFDLIGNPEQVKKIFVSHVKISNGISDHDAPLYLHKTIKEMDNYEPPRMPADCPELYERYDYYNPYDNNFVIEKATTKDFYANLVDAQIYLAKAGDDIDFIMPNTPQPDQLEAQPVAEASEPLINNTPFNKPQYLNNANPNYSPYLAIAVDIWERAYIHNEIEMAKKNAKTKDKNEPIIAIIEQHHPDIPDSWKIAIAKLITTKQGQN